jgi:hypothetical protein
MQMAVGHLNARNATWKLHATPPDPKVIGKKPTAILVCHLSVEHTPGETKYRG